MILSKPFVFVLSACALVASGAVIQRASAQEGTQRPGQSTRANVWIQNRGEGEAVPVSIETIATEMPVRVQVTGVPRVMLASGDPGSVLQVRAVRQSWAYRAVTVTAGQDAVALLNSAGADGWEATGMVLPSAGGTLVVLKRPN
jgi:hypothetical protein